ncbi:MAG: hypothetical protein WBX03_19030 [Terriglobales bacterium]|jgi:hypothetical protein
MKSLTVLTIAFCLFALCLLVVPTVTADQLNRETVVTFSGPVEVPGTYPQILPAGTYVFEIMWNQGNRHIVRIYNQDKSRVFTTIMALPNLRLHATHKTVITFSERPAGQPEALRAWFSPGRVFGEEFVYAKPRAIELAKEVNQPVLATPVEVAAAPIEVLQTAPVEAVAPTGDPVEVAQVVEPPPVVADEPLPHTASPLPLIGLIGMLALGAGFALSIAAKRT